MGLRGKQKFPRRVDFRNGQRALSLQNPWGLYLSKERQL